MNLDVFAWVFFAILATADGGNTAFVFVAEHEDACKAAYKGYSQVPEISLSAGCEKRRVTIQ